MLYLTSFHRHSLAINRVCSEHPGVRADINLNDFGLTVSHRGESSVWRPRFLARLDKRLVYVDRPHPSTSNFVGWLPYALRQWPASTDKLIFKQEAERAGIRTPAACTDPALIGGPFIVKKARSSFGEGIRGPFLAYDAENAAHRLGPGEFYENFILGHIVKAWYWGSRWLVAEFHRPPVVTGDGAKTLRELVEALALLPGSSHDWEAIAHNAAYCGVSDLDEVVAAGKEVLLDLKYGSPYNPGTWDNLNVIQQVRRTPLGEQFVQAGEALAGCVAPNPPEATLFVLDAMVDTQGAVWFLEMNSNPMVHPDCYGAMFLEPGYLKQQQPAGPLATSLATSH
jgi:hypothetical protein